MEGAFLFAKYLHEHVRNIIFASMDENYNFRGDIIDEIVSAGMKFECLNIRGWLGVICHRSLVKDYCKQKGIDIVIVYGLRPTLVTSSLSDIIKIVSVRGMLRKTYPLYYPYGKFISDVFVYLEIKAMKKMDYVFSMTKPMAEWLASEGIDSKKISVVNNFVDVSSIIHSAAVDNPHHGGDINIGIFCNFVSLKRIDVAVRAVCRAVHSYQYCNIRLHLAGDGPLRNNLKKLVCELNLKDRVIFHGFLKNPLHLMQGMDLILLTSEAEGTPRCLMEALCLGKTVIASDIPGIRELIIDRLTGYLFPAGDVEKLAFLIVHVIQNKAYLPPNQLVNHMLKNYDVNIVCERMLSQIEKIYRGEGSAGNVAEVMF